MSQFLLRHFPSICPRAVADQPDFIGPTCILFMTDYPLNKRVLLNVFV